MRKTLLFLLLAVANQVIAQPWLEAMNSPAANLQTARAAFQTYWKDRPEEKGRGIKPFKRWEWFWGQRVQPDGSLPDRSIAWKQWKQYEARHNNQYLRTQNASWTFSGPASTASGYYGIGRLNTIAFHPTDPNTFYVGAPAGGLWKTTNGGVSWTCLTDHLPVIGVSDIAINPTNPNIVYILTGDCDGSDTYSIGVLKSTDGGITWNTTGLNWTVTSFKLLKRIQINPSNPQMLWVAASDGIWRTLDGGANWMNVQPGSFSDLELKPGEPTTLYAASFSANSVIYRSTDAGGSFTQVQTITGGRRLNIAVTPHNPALVQVLASSSSGGLHSLWKSSDAGQSFTQYLTGTTSNNMLSSSSTGTGSGGQGTYDLAFTINPLDSNHVWIGGVNTWASIDGGANWNIKTIWSGGAGPGIPVVHADKHFQVYHPLNPTVLFECNDGGLYKTTNGGLTWTDLSAGLGISQIYRIGVSASTTNQVLAGLQDNSTKEYKNNTWAERRATGDGFESIYDPTTAATMYVTSYYGNIQKSINGGTNWSTIAQASNTGTGVNTPGPWLTPYVMNPKDNNTLLVAKKEIYRSNDGGTTWSQISNFVGSNNATAVVYSPSDTNVIYAAYGQILYKTENGGNTWDVKLMTSSNISYIAVHPTNPQRLWVTMSGYNAFNKVQTSTDGGANWTPLNGSLPNLPVNCIVYQNGSNDGLYIGTDVGVFYRNNTMSDWVPFQNGLPNVIVNELEISYNNNRIWAATYGRGLWSSDLYGAAPCTAPAAPTSGGNSTVCQSLLPGTLTATPPSGSVVDWYASATGGSALATASNTFAAPAAGTYYAESRHSTSGCVSATRTPVTLSVNASPTTPTITYTGNTTFCNNSSLTLNSSAANSNQWYLNGVAINGATAQSYTANQSGSYTVQTTANGCASIASTGVQLIVNPVPPQPTITANGGQLTSSAASGNQWFLNGVAITGATSQVYITTANGNYTVQVTLGGCASPLSTVYNQVSTAINPVALDNVLRIAPNPVRSKLEVVYTGTGGLFHIQLLDMTGHQVLNSGTFTSRYTLNMEAYPAATYIVQVTNKRTGESIKKKIVKQ